MIKFVARIMVELESEDVVQAHEYVNEAVRRFQDVPGVSRNLFSVKAYDVNPKDEVKK